MVVVTPIENMCLYVTSSQPKKDLRKKYLKHGRRCGISKMPETTEKYHHIPVRSKAKDAKIRTISLGKGIKALYDTKNKVIVTYLFDVNQYTMKEAKKWIKKHGEKSVGQLMVAELQDLLMELKGREVM